MLRVVSIFLSLTFLTYLLWPVPQSINDFPELPNSLKSSYPGDTYQVPNVAAYFSNNYRQSVTHFYKDSLGNLNKLLFPPIRLNYPPETAYTYIKDQTQSTYLEEYVYPLRGSLFVNGFEPFTEKGEPRFKGAAEFGVEGRQFQTKTTLRFYPASLSSRLVIWLGINLSSLGLFKLGKKILYA